MPAKHHQVLKDPRPSPKPPSFKVCSGVPLTNLTTNIAVHSVPFKINYDTILDSNISYNSQNYYHHKNCHVLVPSEVKICVICDRHNKKQFVATTSATERN